MISKRTSYKLAILTLSALLVACSSQKTQPQQAVKTNVGNTDMQKLGAKYSGRTYSTAVFTPVSKIDNNSAIVNSKNFINQLNNVRNYSSSITNRFANNYSKIQQWVNAGAKVSDLAKYGIHSQVMSGMDNYQNVLMTGYYSPVIHARRTPQGKYNQPIYAMPANKRFSRSQIYAGALAGKSLELAYSDSMLENFLLGVQGSGYVDFGDGRLNYLAYAGQNGFKYTSVGRLLVEDGEVPKEQMSIKAIREWGQRNPSRVRGLLERNPSYVFFKNDPTGQVKGSAGVPLVSMASVASDRNIVPSGTVLLVEVPEIDRNGNWTGAHKLHLMVALDVGGAVNGQHFDLYYGIGDQAGHFAGLTKHYGRVWVLR
ncbi:murein transglycosylase A [Lonepinella sp. BR2474]|uniref:murein transglycosylase A n=1 Tax=Lonepinella sp. BR2474 TaxID=3434548 RepID=UPI003F6E3C39